MTYIDGVAYSVPNDKKEDFTKFAQHMCETFIRYGALQAVDAWGDDVPAGEVTSFPLAVQSKPDETVCFSWIVWPSKEVHDAAWEQIMADGQMQEPMPFDGTRMIHGTFSIVAEAQVPQ